jgi:hypothetical protein
VIRKGRGGPSDCLALDRVVTTAVFVMTVYLVHFCFDC